MAVKTKVLVWVRPADGRATDVGMFDFDHPPATGDNLSVPNQPTLRVDWRTFNSQVDDGHSLTLGCRYLDAVIEAGGDPSNGSALDEVEEQQSRINNKLRENQKIIAEVQGRSFKDATAYANVIIIAGYAAIFAIWSNTKALMSAVESSSIAGLILFSFLSFVVFELSKMILTAAIMRRNAIAAIREPLASDYLERLVEAEQAGHRNLNLFLRAWPVFLALSIVPALAAAGFLFWKFYSVVLAAVV